MPTLVQRGRVTQMNDMQFHPGNPWLATADTTALSLRPLTGPRAREIWRQNGSVDYAKFAPDGRWLAVSGQRTIRFWSLDREPVPEMTELLSGPIIYLELDTDRGGEWILAGADGDGEETSLISLRSGEVTKLEGFDGQTSSVALSGDGRVAAGTGGAFNPADRQIRIWDVATGRELLVWDLPDGQRHNSLEFCGNDEDLHLYSASPGRFWKWDIVKGSTEEIWSNESDGYGGLQCLADGRIVGIHSNDQGQQALFDLKSGEETVLQGHPLNIAADLDSSGTIFVSGDGAGVIRVSRIGDEQPHVLLGHNGAIKSIAMDPAGRRIASTSEDRTVRLWPMPDLSRPAFHTLPLDEFLDHLKALTNYRVVPDESEPSGFRVTTVPFDGWETVPEWW